MYSAKTLADRIPTQKFWKGPAPSANEAMLMCKQLQWARNVRHMDHSRLPAVWFVFIRYCIRQFK